MATGPRMRRASLFSLLCICAAALHTHAQPSGDAALDSLVATASVPEELAPALATNKAHVVINNHMDLTGLPTLTTGDRVGTDAVIGSTPNTQSLRGNCSQPSELAHPDYPWRPGQCVLTVREDWLQLDVVQSQFWLHALYVRIVGNATGGHGQATLVGSHRGDLWMTDVTMVGSGTKGRAVDVGEGRSLYARDCAFSLFDKDKQTVVRVKKAATATFVRCHFEDNNARTRDSEKRAVGPAVGLEHDADNATIPAGYAWFQDCTFENNTMAHTDPALNVPLHAVSIADAAARVFTNTAHAPLVYNRDTEAVVEPTVLAPAPEGVQPDGQGVFGGREFLTEDSPFFAEVSQVDIGTPPFERLSLPNPESFVTYEPRAGGGGDDDDDDTVTALAVVVGLLGALALCALCALGALCCLRRRRKAGARTSTDSSSGSVGKGGEAALFAPKDLEAGANAAVSPGKPVPAADGVVRAHATGPTVFQAALGSRHSSGFSATPAAPRGAAGYSAHSVALTPESTAAASLKADGSRAANEMLHIMSESRGYDSTRSTLGAAPASQPALTASTMPTSSSVPDVPSEGARTFDAPYYGAPPRLHAYDAAGSAGGQAARAATGDLGLTSDASTDGWTATRGARGEPAPQPELTQAQVVEMLAAVHAAGELFEGKYRLLGPAARLRSGSAIVQFAEVASGGEVALKFYAQRREYDRVAALAASPTLAPLTWPIADMLPNDWRRAHAGNVLPACVALRRGEPLDTWAQRTRPDHRAALGALAALARLLRTLHDAGHVCVSLAPSNVAWFAEERKWALIDYKRIVRTGTGATLGPRPHYLAPELVGAEAQAASAEGEAAASRAADVWALGVVAYDLLAGRRAFAAGAPDDAVRAMVSGSEPLPWEVEDEPGALGPAGGSVLRCLRRAPSDRPSAEVLAAEWAALAAEAGAPAAEEP